MIKVLDFHCLKCGHVFEEWINTRTYKIFNTIICPICNSESRQNEIQLTNKTKHESWKVK